MRRSYGTHAGGLLDLVLDIPLYSASMEHLADRCGHEMEWMHGILEGELGVATAPMGQDVNGVYLCGNIADLPLWLFEPISDGCYTISFFSLYRGVRGHGWCWESRSNIADNVYPVQCATSMYGWDGLFGTVGQGPKEEHILSAEYLMTPHFVTVVANDGEVSVFFDGAFLRKQEGDCSATLHEFSRIGIRQTVTDCGNSSNNVFRQFKLFRKALSPDEIAALYVDELAEFNAAATTI